jgi:hypothetical protein
MERWREGRAASDLQWLEEQELEVPTHGKATDRKDEHDDDDEQYEYEHDDEHESESPVELAVADDTNSSSCSPVTHGTRPLYHRCPDCSHNHSTQRFSPANVAEFPTERDHAGTFLGWHPKITRTGRPRWRSRCFRRPQHRRADVDNQAGTDEERANADK